MAHTHSTISKHFCCPNCAGDVALYNTPGGEPAYHCQNARCCKVVMLEAIDALALKPTQPTPPSTPAARKAAYQIAQGVQIIAHAGGYLVPSATRTIVHFVAADGSCSCEARGTCWHQAAVAQQLRKVA